MERLLAWLDFMAEQGKVPSGEERCRAIGDGIFELKPLNYRVFFFYDSMSRRTVILASCYKKQGQKTPKREIRRAEEQREKFLQAQGKGHVTYELD